MASETDSKLKMAAVKKYTSDTGGATVLTLFHRVRFQDGKMLDNTDGVFRAGVTFANSKVPALEITVVNGFSCDVFGWYETSESRTVHADGKYTFECVDALGVQYAGAGCLEILADAAVTLASRATPGDVTASQGVITTAMLKYYKTVADLLGKILSKLMGV